MSSISRKDHAVSFDRDVNRSIAAALRDRIDADPRQMITATTLATETDRTASELRSAIKAHSGATLSDFMLHYRLDAVREVLRRGDTEIAAAARAWGFVHLGRFTEAYLRRNGESPSQTKSETTHAR